MFDYVFAISPRASRVAAVHGARITIVAFENVRNDAIDAIVKCATVVVVDRRQRLVHATLYWIAPVICTFIVVIAIFSTV